MTPISLTVNGTEVAASVEARTSLADFLRDGLNLTGTHLGCEHGVCGACTVLVDGVPIRSCITLVPAVSGAAVTTIEGPDDDPVAEALRAAFSREHALQCGFCTPGMIIAARDYAIRAEAPREADVRTAMSGNLCRCTGYHGIVQALLTVVAERRMSGVAAVPGAARSALGPAGSGYQSIKSSPSDTPVEVIGRERKKVRQAAPASLPFEPHAHIAKSFVVEHPRKVVWSVFANPRAVAACMPGVELDEGTDGPDEHMLAGNFRIKLGPIASDFRGAGTVDYAPEEFTGTIRGRGMDRRRRSAAHGEIVYRLSEHPNDATKVDVTVAYALTGPLAQFGRSRIVEDVADRLALAFVANLTRRLSDPNAANEAPNTTLHAGDLVASVVRARLKRLLRRLFARRGR